jgi:hypothetical protein
MSSQEERAARLAAIEEVRQKLGAKPFGVYEPPADCVFLTTIENRFKGMKGGTVIQVGKRDAAVLIVDRSHRLSTSEEIEAYHRDDWDRQRAAANADNRANRRAVIFTKPPVAAEESPGAPVDEPLTPSEQ